MNEQFQRTESILGAESTARLKKCRIAVFGVGGVGGYVVEALARSGIGVIDMTDSDKVDITNINRQIIATHDTVGCYKVDVFEERIHSICPETTVNIYKGLYLPSSSKSVESLQSDGADETKMRIYTEKDYDFTAYDYIVDAIDNVTAKISLVCEADRAGTPVISAMGCGNRIDPAKLKQTDIFKTHDDPLAKIMRRKLRAAGIRRLKVVCSEEAAMKPSGESRSPGSSPFVPASAGLMIAGIVVRDLLEV